jgi:hypothetical protein
MHIVICVPSLVEIAPGVPDLCWNIHTYIHCYIYIYIYTYVCHREWNVDVNILFYSKQTNTIPITIRLTFRDNRIGFESD